MNTIKHWIKKDKKILCDETIILTKQNVSRYIPQVTCNVCLRIIKKSEVKTW